MSQIVKIKAKTSNEFSDIFDFSSSNYSEQDFSLISSGLMIRNKDSLKFSNQTPLIGSFSKGISINDLEKKPEKPHFTEIMSFQDQKSLIKTENEALFCLKFKDGFLLIFYRKKEGKKLFLILDVGYIWPPESLLDQNIEIFFALNSKLTELSFEKPELLCYKSLGKLK